MKEVVAGESRVLGQPGLHIKKNCISSLKTAASVFPLLVCSSYVYIHLLGKLIAVDGQEDDFCLSCIIFMNRNTLE